MEKYEVNKLKDSNICNSFNRMLYIFTKQSLVRNFIKDAKSDQRRVIIFETCTRRLNQLRRDIESRKSVDGGSLVTDQDLVVEK